MELPCLVARVRCRAASEAAAQVGPFQSITFCWNFKEFFPTLSATGSSRLWRPS